MYRRRSFHAFKKRDQKRIVAAILRKVVWSLWILLWLLFGLWVFYKQWEFILLWVFFIGIYALIQIFRIIKRRELRRYFTIDHLQRLSPTHFEWYVIELFNTIGYKIEWTWQTGDEGIDGIGTDREGNKLILQMKRYADTSKIQTEHMRAFFWALDYHDIDIGIYVTTGYATSGVREAIEKHRKKKKVILIDKDRLVELIDMAYRSKKRNK